VSSEHFGQMATLYLHVAGATFRELVDARLALEPLMARWAAKRRDPETIAELKEVVAEAEITPVSDSSAQFEAGKDFHAVVVGASGNRVLDLLARGIGSIYAERITGIVFPLEAREQVVQAHAAIAQAIIDGDPDRAEELMRVHMTELAEHAERRYPGFLDERVDWK
jgi:DNA-binding FadR family transcriptional regulator